jgi:Arc/MetJ-type ribon-helix-helix transcriptional regulator
VTVAWGPFGVTVVTVKKSWVSGKEKHSHEVHVGEFAAMDEAVRQALVALSKEKADEHRHAIIVGPERNGSRRHEATVDHPEFGGHVHKSAPPPPPAPLKSRVSPDDEIGPDAD